MPQQSDPSDSTPDPYKNPAHTKRGAMPEAFLAGEKFHRMLSCEIFSNAKKDVEQPNRPLTPLQ
jgi:hypothetical protein